jgi:glucosamine-phosphate N-acetyltransferase
MLLDESPLFEPSLLNELDWNASTVSFSPPISPSSPGQDLVLRPLCLKDFNRGTDTPNLKKSRLSYQLSIKDN